MAAERVADAECVELISYIESSELPESRINLIVAIARDYLNLMGILEGPRDPDINILEGLRWFEESRADKSAVNKNSWEWWKSHYCLSVIRELIELRSELACMQVDAELEAARQKGPTDD